HQWSLGTPTVTALLTHSRKTASLTDWRQQKEVPIMAIPTEPIGSIPRPPELIEALQQFSAGQLAQVQLDALLTHAVRDTIQHFEATGSPVITDGEQTKPSFATYPVQVCRTSRRTASRSPLPTATCASCRGSR